MGKRNSPEKGCPVMKAFLSISTGTSPWTDDQILAEIKKRNSFLAPLTRSELNGILGPNKTTEIRNIELGFIRHSYKLREGDAREIRCEYVVFNVSDRDSNLEFLLSGNPKWRGATFFSSRSKPPVSSPTFFPFFTSSLSSFFWGGGFSTSH